jgi:hypothetical protein
MIKDMIEICAKHARVKNVKKNQKYGLDSRNSVRNESKNPKGCMANHLRTETDPISETLFLGIQNDGKSAETFCEFCTTYTVVRILSKPTHIYIRRQA